MRGVLRNGAVAVLILGSATAAGAQDGSLNTYSGFTFRSVTPPEPGHQGPRINISIGDGTDASPDRAAEPAPAVPDTAPDASSSIAWFWDEVSDGMAPATRFAEAMAVLASAPEAANLPILRAEALREIALQHDRSILQASIGSQVSPALVLAVIAVESGGDARAGSSAGAQGLMQLIPATAERFGVEDVFDPEQNIAGGVAYLNWLLEEFDRDPVLALAGYNAGEGAVRQAGGVPDYEETRNYVPRVLATWQLTRLLCLTPPELVTDGCVLQTVLAGQD